MIARLSLFVFLHAASLRLSGYYHPIAENSQALAGVCTYIINQYNGSGLTSFIVQLQRLICVTQKLLIHLSNLKVTYNDKEYSTHLFLSPTTHGCLGIPHPVRSYGAMANEK